MKNLVVVLSGPSGAGKGSIFKEISKKRSDVYRYVSTTTRKIRPSEIQGVDYDFITVDEFLEKEKNGYFLETSFFDGNYYGTPKVEDEMLSERDVFFDLNGKGAMKIKEAYPHAILFYILPPNFERLKIQLGNRGNARIELGKQEVPTALEFDWLIINDNVEEAAQRVLDIMDIIRKNLMSNEENQEFVKNFYY